MPPTSFPSSASTEPMFTPGGKRKRGFEQDVMQESGPDQVLDEGSAAKVSTVAFFRMREGWIRLTEVFLGIARVIVATPNSASISFQPYTHLPLSLFPYTISSPNTKHRRLWLYSHPIHFHPERIQPEYYQQ